MTSRSLAIALGLALLAAMLVSETAHWGRVVMAAGIKPE